MSIIKGDSLLSNISNISVLIEPNQGSSVFNFPMVQNSYDNEQSEKLFQVKIDDIYPGVDYIQANNSILDKIIKKEESQGSIMRIGPTPILPQFTICNRFNEKSWRITKQNGFSQDEASPEQQPQKEQQNQRKVKNETKNIPKNYGKAIITFIEKYKNVVADVCEYTNVPFEDFYGQMAQIKKNINTIADLRRLWMDYKFSRCMRIISNLFLRKYSLNYIFNSRICNFRSHIKYRHRLCEAIKNPNAFRHIKDY